MAKESGKRPDLSLRRVYSNSLDASNAWYAINVDICYRVHDFLSIEENRTYLNRDFVELSLDELRQENGAQIPTDWFGPRAPRRATVVVATLYGIIYRIIRMKKHPKETDVAFGILEAARKLLNKSNLTPLDQDRDLAGVKYEESELQPISHAPLTPPATPVGNLKRCFDSSRASKSFQDIENLNSAGPRQRAKRAKGASSVLFQQLRRDFTQSGEAIGQLFGNSFLYDEDQRPFIKEAISTTLNVVCEKKGPRKGFAEILDEDVLEKYISTMKVSDWVQLLVKLSTKLPDRCWQTVLSYLCIGKSGKSTDVGILLTNNEIRAQKELVFSVTRQLFKVELMPDVRGYGASLEMILVWAIRECRLHANIPTNIEFNLKLDGRPLGGTYFIFSVILNFSPYITSFPLHNFPLHNCSCYHSHF
ncbi:uncharacterized protein LOC125572454 [Nematostella vectensis]|uniref:uncharacterized protein LOC125572454 n=1 Tax=Nematostella vectensis TaxID=45351 RepID=UPI0020770DC8|nr:uncharacterized protein LOC125572454 [Nematostella vectensis]